MPGESLSFSITADDRASSKFRDVGRAALDSSAKIDVAAASLKLWDDTAAKQGKAATTSLNAMKAHAAATKLLADAENVLAGKATTTTKLLADQGRKLDDAGKTAEKAAGGFSSLAGGGGVAGGGMGALVAAGVLLSPVLVTLGAGLGGLALAALGAGKNSKILAQEITPLKQDFAGFQKALQPTLLADFAAGAQLAGHVLKDIQPVTVATGKALGTLFGQLDRMFASGEWQSFFSFMARTAGPDLQLVGKLFIDLASDLPPLLVALQPVASVLLKTADALALTGRAAEQLSGGPLTAMENFGNAGQSVKDSATGVSGLNAALEILVGPQQTHSIDNFFHSLHDGFNILTGAEKGAAVNLGQFQRVTIGSVPAVHALTTQTITTVTPMDRLGKAAAVTSFQIKDTGKNAFYAVGPYDRLGKVATVLVGAQRNLASTSRPVVTNFDEQIKRLTGLVTAYKNALTVEENYINAQIAEANDLASLNKVLKASHDRIGLKTQAERDSFAATQTYINQTTQTGDAAVKTGKGIQGQIDVIERAIPRLEAVKGKTAEYKQELDKLKSILDRLRAEKLISEVVHVTGQGTWRFGAAPGGSVAGPGGHFAQAGGRAAGGMIGGGVPGRDSVPIMAMPGEVVVPTGMVRAGAVDHLRGSLPGFAAGGIVPSYHGSVAGLAPWTSANQQATVNAISVSIAKAMASSFSSAFGFGAAGPGGGAPAANAALARRMMPAWGSGAEWAAWNYVAMRESGWSQFARNPSSGAYGIPQALPPSKMGPAANPPQSNPAAQISWMIGYIRGRYGDPIGAAAHERAFNWYDKGGYLPTGLSLSYNGTGRPEMVVPNSSSGALGGQTVIVNVTVGHGTHPVAAAQELAKILNAGARNGVRLRTSILGPG